MKRIPAVLLAFALTAALFAGCGSSNQANQGNQDSVVTLKVNNFAPAALPFGVGIDHAAEYIERESNGAIKVEVYHDGTLLGFNDTYQGVRQKVADIGIVGPAATDSVVTLNSVFTTMQKYLPKPQEVTDACYELIDLVPELQEEMETVGVRWLGLYALFGSSLHCRGIKPLTPDDMKGVGIEALGGVSGYFALMGANALTLDPADYYLSMERGVIQAQAVHWPGLDGYKCIELTDYHLMFGADGGGIFFGIMGYIINADTWHSLSPEHQKIVWDGFRSGSTLTIDLDYPSAEYSKNYAAEQGQEFVYLSTPEELAPWYEYIDQFNALWVENVAAAGFPAQSTLDKLQELLAKY
ncbi:MAG: TRAP transporter substrate-binding protein DctP [Oscillospiraceae bacterium]|nr:TRAP transporter substrate-binding protein DctP [Oscillospiraceae bacterium]